MGGRRALPLALLALGVHPLPPLRPRPAPAASRPGGAPPRAAAVDSLLLTRCCLLLLLFRQLLASCANSR